MVKDYVKKLYLVLMLLFLYAPIILLIIFSFNNGKSMARWDGFSFHWYGELFSDPVILNSLYVTLSVAALSTVFATLLGTAAAIGIHNMKKRTRLVVNNITNLPVMNPDIVTGISMMLLFVFLNIQRGYGTLLIAHITFNLPYVILSVLPKLQQMPGQLYEAAMDLGATPFSALRKVILPEVMPGVITGAIMSFTLSIDDFVISFFTQEGVQNLSITIYSMARRGINPKINALSALLFIIVLALLILVYKRSNVNNENGKRLNVG